MRRLLPLAVALSLPLAVVAASPAAATELDYSDTARNIIPSGQPGSFPVPDGADSQAKMYDGLTPLFDQVSTGDLNKYFKSAKFGSDDSCPCTTEAVPRAGTTIVRDANKVPHITGVTRDDVTWGAGYVFAEDRALLLSLGRYPGRLAALDAPGINAFSLVTSARQVTITPEADRIIEEANTASLLAQGQEGRDLLHDIDVYVEGANAQLRASNSSEKPLTRVDVYSTNALAGQIFGQGGGAEVANAQLRAALVNRLGEQQGLRVFDELRGEDGDAPVTNPDPAPYEARPADGSTDGNALLDATPVDARTRKNVDTLDELSRTHTSNYLMVDKERSKSGHPILVGGPQVGYFYPGLTLEMDLHGPGIDARGAAIPGGPGNILIGRGPDLAWSLTSAGADTNDIFVETLCEGSDTKYVFKGECRDMQTIDAGSIAGQGRVVFQQTVHGPVQGYATVGGRRVAISFARSSRGHDIDWQLMFSRLSKGEVTDPTSFFAAAAKSPFTFNISYLDDQHIANYTAGRLPIRAQDVDPRLPTDGRGDDEWQGFLSDAAHPQAVDPASGRLVNWNNRPAKQFGPSDSQRDLDAVHRVDLLNNALDEQVAKGGGKVDPAGVVSAMNKAATQDLRATGTTFSALRRVLRSGPAPDARSQQMLEALEAWERSGSSRLDRDLDGTIDAGGAPGIMDALFPRVRDAVLAPVLGPQLQQFTAFLGNNGTGSGFTGGGISLVNKDLRQLLGESFSDPLEIPLCGNGDLAACRASLWTAMQQAGDQIAQAQGTQDPAAWTTDARPERISFAPGLLSTTIRYTNRPSGIQQVISFSGHRPRPAAVVPPVTPPVTPAPRPTVTPSTRRRSPKVGLSFGTFRLSRTGRATVTLRCPASRPALRCAGTVTVKRSSKRLVRVRYSVAAGKRVRTSFRVPARVRSIVARRGRTLLRVEVVNSVKGLSSTRTVRAGRLKARR